MRARGGKKRAGKTVVFLTSALVLCVLMIVSIREFDEYIREQKSSEATLMLDRMFEGAHWYYDEHSGIDGKALPHGKQPSTVKLPLEENVLPKSTEWTPRVPCCDQIGKKCSGSANEAEWQHPTWRALDFSTTDDFHYQYRFIVEKDMVYCQARGDLDCDGKYSHFERRCSSDPEKLDDCPSSVQKENPLE